MKAGSARLALLFSCLGHAYMHLFTAFYFVIALSLEAEWGIPNHELLKLWALGSLLVGLAALPAGWLGDRWSAPGMMTVYFIGLGLSGIVCGLMDSTAALMLGLTAIGLFSAIYHPVGIAWLVRSAKKRGMALAVNGIFGSLGVASAGLIAGLLIDLFSWRAAFIVPGVICLGTGIALFLALRLGWVSEGGPEEATDPPAARNDMIRVFLILLLTMSVMGLMFHATQASLPKVFDLRMRDLTGEGAFGIGVLVALVYTAGGIMQLAGGWMADRFPLKLIYVGAFALQIPVMALIATAGSMPLIALAVLTVLLSAVALPAENMLLARYTPQKHRGLAYGVKFVLAFAVANPAILLASWVEGSSGDYVWLYLILSIAAAGAAFATLFLPNKRPQATVAVPAE
ncbi:MFS transporter [Pelagibius litoralis]|uniref:MFS transporter n=1 Tax=Pelagibius litoralis TaxID=374515 RepID=A0A967C4F8_9PROT|nr:MFS transporter [Pelagibius litoralis]NIA67061.1 MFS transporter [Pelagibius litoralis]